MKIQLLIVLATLSFFACESDDPIRPASSTIITVSPSNLTVLTDDTLTLQVTNPDSAAHHWLYIWTVSGQTAPIRTSVPKLQFAFPYVGCYVVRVSALDSATYTYSHNIATSYVIITTPAFTASQIDSMRSISIDCHETLLFQHGDSSFTQAASISGSAAILHDHGTLSGNYSDGSSTDTRFTSRGWSAAHWFKATLNYRYQTLDSFYYYNNNSTVDESFHPFYQIDETNRESVSIPKVRLLKNSSSIMVFGITTEELQTIPHSFSTDYSWTRHTWNGYSDVYENNTTTGLNAQFAGNTNEHIYITLSK